jgi:DNA-binding MarR family transcriptional regulator
MKPSRCSDIARPVSHAGHRCFPRESGSPQIWSATTPDLERLGYVERIPDPADGRAKLVCLTKRGARAQREARKIVAEIEGDWGRALGGRDLAALRALLERLHDVLWPPSVNGSY